MKALFGLRDDLHLRTGNRYSMSAAIFYLGFIVGAYPAMYLAQRFPIERVASGIVTVWGLCLILTVVCRDYKELYAQRFFLGLLESGISPMSLSALSIRRMSKPSEWGMSSTALHIISS
jgi:MFS family permease